MNVQSDKEELIIGAHVGMNGKELFLGSVKEAISYGANTFMFYTGAPQNTRRKNLSEMRIEEGKELLEKNDFKDIIVHAPYIINLGNSVKEETFSLAVEFLEKELERTAAFGSKYLVLHPGAHVGASEEVGIKQIIKGLNQVLTGKETVYVALETMAGKGSELGKTFEELAQIYDGVTHNDRLRVCFDTCHTHDAGYDIKNNFDGVIEKFDKLIGKKQIAVFHINDSKNECGAAKDRHANLGDGKIGFEALYQIVHHKDFREVPKILETPYLTLETGEKVPPYKEEIKRLREK